MSAFNINNSFSNSSYGLENSSAVRNLIIINLIAFVMIYLFRSFPFLAWFGLVPSYVFGKFRIWQLVTYLFMHAGLWHLILNMLMLWMFGSAIEQMWGSKRFLQYFFFTGIGAGLCSLIFAFGSSYPVVGASGAIFGLLVAYGVMFPDNVIMLFLIFPMKMKHAVIVLGLINLLGAISSSGSGIAYIAHLGGGVLGYVYLKNESLRSKLASLSFFRWKNIYKQRQKVRKQQEIRDLDQEVDNILDKISKDGLNSLTSREKKLLAQKSRQMM